MFSIVKNQLNSFKNYFRDLLHTIFLKAYVIKGALENNQMSNFNSLSSMGTCKISYVFSGDTYNLFLPYNSSKALDMLKFKVMLKFEGNKCIDITQQPGVAYNFPPHVLGGEKYIIIDTSLDVEVMMETNEAPGYLEKYIVNIDD